VQAPFQHLKGADVGQPVPTRLSETDAQRDALETARTGHTMRARAPTRPMIYGRQQRLHIPRRFTYDVLSPRHTHRGQSDTQTTEAGARTLDGGHARGASDAVGAVGRVEGTCATRAAVGQESRATASCADDGAVSQHVGTCRMESTGGGHGAANVRGSVVVMWSQLWMLLLLLLPLLVASMRLIEKPSFPAAPAPPFLNDAKARTSRACRQVPSLHRTGCAAVHGATNKQRSGRSAQRPLAQRNGVLPEHTAPGG